MHSAALLNGAPSTPVCMQRLRHPRDVPATCSYAARPQRCSRLLARQRQRVVRVCAAQSLYEVLGVTSSASERDIKRAYRQKALKLHPDVNKAPNAEAQFLEVKSAFSVLSDPVQRAQYDRKLRGGFGGLGDFGGWGSTTAGSAAGGSSSSSSSAGSRPRPKQQEEEFYGLGDFLSDVGSSVGSWVQQQAGEVSKMQQEAADLLRGVARTAGESIQAGKLEDFFNDLEKEVSAWSAKRGGKPASLWEELAAIGEEFVDFLETGLGEEYKSSGGGGGKEGSSEHGAASFNAGGRPRSPLDTYEQLKRRYDLYDESQGGGKAATGAAAGSKADTFKRQGSSNGSSTTTSSSKASAPPPPRQRTRDEEVEDELAALKKRMGKM